jgi:hypothetical protein
MAEVTVELGRLLDKTNFKLFDFTYQFDDSNFKAQLEQQIIDYYYDYEIGFETPDMFKRKFKARWNRIIGYYNKLYNTTLLTYNPLTNYKLEEVLDQLASTNNTQTTDLRLTGSSNGSTIVAQDVIGNNTENTTTTNNLNSQTTSNETNSDYPQQPIAGGNYASGAATGSSTTTNTGTVKNDTTVTTDNRTDNTTTNETTDSTTNTGTVTNEATANMDYTKTIEGVTGTTYPELIEKHRDSLLRINDRIIEEMKPCFILVY